jgi:hypothetical protein
MQYMHRLEFKNLDAASNSAAGSEINTVIANICLNNGPGQWSYPKNTLEFRFNHPVADRDGEGGGGRIIQPKGARPWIVSRWQ